MAIKMTDKEKSAINEKLNNRDRRVVCPRCGNTLIYEKRGNSIAVECKTEGCIYGGIRGL